MKRWFKYIQPYLPFFILGPLCMIIEVIGEMLMPLYLSSIINNEHLTVISSIGVAGLMILTALVMMAGGIGGAYFGSKASVNFAADLREDVYRKVQKFSFANIDKFSTGSLVTRLTNDVTQVQNFTGTLLRGMFRSPIMLVGALIMSFTLKKELAWVIFAIVPFMALGIFIMIKTASPRYTQDRHRKTRGNRKKPLLRSPS